MNKDELKQYRSIVAEIRELKENIRKNTVHDTVTGSDSNYPYIQHTMSVKGITREAEDSALHLNELRRKAADIKAWVDNIPDFYIRQEIELLFIVGYKKPKMKHVLKRVYPDMTVDKREEILWSEYKKIERYIKKFAKS